jgi:uncharacterized protein (DUF736 family)
MKQRANMAFYDRRAVEAAVFFKGKAVCAATARTSGGFAYLVLPIQDPVLWNVRNPNLYDLRISWGEDHVEGYFKVLLDNPRICAFCYTQLTDVEQEQNGIYAYDRRPKFDTARLKAIFGAPAAIEKDR